MNEREIDDLELMLDTQETIVELDAGELPIEPVIAGRYAEVTYRGSFEVSQAQAFKLFEGRLAW